MGNGGEEGKRSKSVVNKKNEKVSEEDLNNEKKEFTKLKQSKILSNRKNKMEKLVRISGIRDMSNNLEIQKNAFARVVYDVIQTIYPNHNYRISLRGLAALYI